MANELIDLKTINALKNIELSREVVESSDFAANYELLTRAAEELNDIINDLKTKILTVAEAVYQEEGVSGLTNDKYKFTYVAPTSAVTVDSAKLKANFPEVYNQVLKTSNRKASLKVTAVKVETDE